MVLRACQPMLRIAQSYKRLTRSDPEFYAPDQPPNLFTLAENIANISISSINPLENLQITESVVINVIGKFNHLIEEFSILGVSNEEVRNSISNFQGLTNGITAKPHTLFHKSWNPNSASLDCLKNFLFPFGYEIKTIPNDNLQPVIENHIIRDTVQQDSKKFYFFKLNSEFTTSNSTGCESDVLKESNPNLFYNYYCIYNEALHVIVIF